MKKATVYILLLMLSLGACRAQKGLNYTNNKAGAQQIAQALDKAKDNSLLATLKATLADCEAIMRTKEDAQKLYNYSERLHKHYPDQKMVGAKNGQTEVLINVLVPGDDAKSEKDRFAGGYIQILDKFTKGIRIYTFRYVKPGNTSGMRYDGLTYVNKRWVLIPKMWRAFR
jgi:hypothetical protein